MDKCCTDNVPLISIVVPVFNVEMYVERCILSLVSQSYEKIEIIIVDDGSTDSSGRICEKYKDRDSRIKVIHKSNGGPSDARNIGMKCAQGEYIAFVDSDDWVAGDYISEMYRRIVQTNSDIAICGFWNTSKYKAVKKKKDKERYSVYFQEEIIKQLLYRKISTSVWGKLYKIALWNDVRFPLQKTYEEIEPIYFILSKCQKIVYMDKRLYYYFFRGSSIVNQKFSINKMDYIENCKSLLMHVRIDYPQFENAAISRLMWADVHVLVHMDEPKEYLNEYQIIMNDIKQYRDIVLKDKENRLETRIAAALTYLGYGILKMIFKLKQIFSGML
ncbi:MAG: glycosyltransferase [Lachnospiraceae bacterium]|nr:glycosyltransferase [Lachnospiraceae bacterium]